LSKEYSTIYSKYSKYATSEFIRGDIGGKQGNLVLMRVFREETNPVSPL